MMMSLVVHDDVINSHLDKACVSALSSKLVFLSIVCLAVSYVVRSVEKKYPGTS